MDNKIIALSDDELMEVTGGLVQLINPSSCNNNSKKNCQNNGNCKCTWSTKSNSCTGGCL